MTLSDKTTLGYEGRKWKRVEDVKEFIKDLKIGIVENDIFTADEIFRVIDKLAGDKLIDQRGKTE